jgi:Fe-S-cluster containining protein
MSTTLDTESAPAPAESPIEALERQATEGAMHAHTVDSRLAERIHSLESALYGLVDLLVEKRVLGESELAAAAHNVARALEERGERAHGGVMLRVDPPEGHAPATVNCAERMHVCKAVCCRLSFPLTAEEVQDGQLKWDLGRPYFIRHGARGACVHQDATTGACGVYERRPGICKGYSCENDGRIWKDFANMILNSEWLEEHLGPERPQLIQLRMDRIVRDAAG